MKLRQFAIAIALLSILVASPRLAAAESTRAWSGDERIAQRVSIIAEGISIDEFLQQLSSKVGIKLKVNPELADDKVVIFCEKEKLGSVLSNLAALFNANWARDKAATPDASYLLFRGQSARKQEDELNRASLLRIEAELDERVKALSESSEQLARRPENDRIREVLSDPEERRATEIYSWLTSGQREQFLTNQSLRLPYSAFAPSQQQVLERSLAEEVERERSQAIANGEVPKGTGVVSTREDLELLGVSFELDSSQGRSMAYVQFARGESLDLGWLDSPSNSILPRHGNPYTGAADQSDTPMPEAQTIRSVRDTLAWVDRLKMLSEGSGMPIFSDYFRGERVTVLPRKEAVPSTENPSANALDGFCASEGVAWWPSDSALFFRKRDWFRQRQREVPDRWILSMSSRLKAQGEIPKYNDLLELGKLSISQICGLYNLSKRHDKDEKWFRDLAPLLEIIGPYLRGSSSFLPSGSAQSALTHNTATKDAILIDRLTASQEGALFQLAQVQPFPLSREVLKGSIAVRCYCPTPPLEVQATGYRNVPLNIWWGLKTVGGVGYEHEFTVYLPLGLPADRRSETRIAVQL